MRFPAIAIASLLVSGEPVLADCKSDLLAVLDPTRSHGPSQQDITTALTKSSPEMAKLLEDTFNDRTIVRSVPPDRIQSTTFRNGVLQAEAITIGALHWDRDAGSPWKARQPRPNLGGPDATNVIAKTLGFTDGTDLLEKTVRSPECLGRGRLEGRTANQFRFEIATPGAPTTAPSMVTKITIWLEPDTSRPIRTVTAMIGPEIETALTINYSYDASIKIEPPTVPN